MPWQKRTAVEAYSSCAAISHKTRKARDIGAPRAGPCAAAVLMFATPQARPGFAGHTQFVP